MTVRRLRIYVGERDKDPDGHVLHESIVLEAHRRGLAGASVFRGAAGYGAHSRVHTAKILRLSEDLPVVVEIVDQAEPLAGFVRWLATVLPEGLATLEDVEVAVDARGRLGGRS